MFKRLPFKWLWTTTSLWLKFKTDNSNYSLFLMIHHQAWKCEHYKENSKYFYCLQRDFFAILIRKSFATKHPASNNLVLIKLILKS